MQPSQTWEFDLNQRNAFLDPGLHQRLCPIFLNTKFKFLWPSERSSFQFVGCETLRCISGYAQTNFFCTTNFGSEKYNLSICRKFFEIFWLFSKTTHPNLKIWLQWVKRILRSTLAQAMTTSFFYTKIYEPRIVQIFDFLPFPEAFWFFAKLPSELWDFEFIRKKVERNFPCKQSCPTFF